MTVLYILPALLGLFILLLLGLYLMAFYAPPRPKERSGAMYKLLETGKDPAELSEAELNEVCGFAVRMSGLSVTKSGAIPSIPDKDE